MFKRSKCSIGERLGFSVLACVLVVGTAAGQGVGESAAVPQAIDYAAGHVWLGAGMGTPIRSVAAGTTGRMIVLTEDGRVFRNSENRTWREVLGAPGLRLNEPGEVDDEALLLDAEGFLDETEDITRPEFRPPRDESDEEESDAEGQEVNQPLDRFDLGDDLVDMYATDTHSDTSSMSPSSGRLVWKSESVAGLALVARMDGVWRSDDDGYTWARSESLLGVHAFIDGPGGGILAGTKYGVYRSRDSGRTWRTIKDPIGSIETFCFAVDGDRFYAGTSEGLFKSGADLRWAKMLSRYDADVPVWAIAIDKHWDQGMWVVGPVGILRSDNGGEQLRSAGQNTLMGTVSLLPLEQPGHLLAGGVDGVWESTDGGLRWRPVANGLPSPASRWLAMTSEGPVVGGNDGIFRLETAKEAPTAAGPVQRAVVEPPGSEMPALVHVAVSRPGMAMNNILTKNIVARSMLLPKLSINGRLDRARSIQADYDAESNTGSMRRSWSVGMTACFGSCGSSMGYSDVGESGGYDGSSVDSDAVTVVGGEVYGAAESGSIAPMAANVAERGTRYRTDVASRVSELVLARHRLLEARSVIRTLSLREQVGHELDILESAARLDVYTNGYFSRVLQDS